jgi:hypothetical protein
MTSMAHDASKYWVETPSKLPPEAPQVYYYNLKSKEVSWDRPSGPGLQVVTHADLLQMARA